MIDMSILCTCSAAQIRALAYQNDITTWQTDSVVKLKEALLDLEVIKGLETCEYGTKG